MWRHIPHHNVNTLPNCQSTVIVEKHSCNRHPAYQKLHENDHSPWASGTDHKKAMSNTLCHTHKATLNNYFSQNSVWNWRWCCSFTCPMWHIGKFKIIPESGLVSANLTQCTFSMDASTQMDACIESYYSTCCEVDHIHTSYYSTLF